MSYILSVKVLLFPVLLGLASGVWYEAQFTESILSCKDFTNENIQADQITLGMSDGSDDTDPGFGLNGPLVLKCPIDDTHNMNMNIFKATELGEEYMFKSGVSPCESMEDENTPWWPMYQMMNVSSCPINESRYFGTVASATINWSLPVIDKIHDKYPVSSFCLEGSYNIKNLVLSVEAFSEFLSRDFCGEYSIELTLVKDLDNVVSCHILQVAIVEHEDDE